MYGGSSYGALLGDPEFYWGLSGEGRTLQVSWAEHELADAARRLRVSWFAGQVPELARALRVSYAAMELESPERTLRVSWARMRLEESQIEGFGLLVGRELLVTVANEGD